MSLLDRYVTRIVAGAFVTVLLFFVLLSIVMDVLQRLSSYVAYANEKGYGWFDFVLMLGGYYLRFLPVLFTTITPFVTVIACMFSVARLQGANEVVPMLFVGRRTHRVLLPMLVCGALAALAMAASWQWLVPQVGASLAVDESSMRGGPAKLQHLVHEVFGETTQQLYVETFEPRATPPHLSGVAMLEQGSTPQATMLQADGAVWDAARGDWRLERGTVASAEGERPREWLGRPDLPPAVLLLQGRESLDPELLSYTDLLELATLRPNRPDVRLALHRHVTNPLANLILLLLALPLAISFERGSRIGRLLAAIGLCGAFVMFELTCQSLGQQGMLHPIVAAWTPIVVFGALGIVSFGSMKT